MNEQPFGLEKRSSWSALESFKVNNDDIESGSWSSCFSRKHERWCPFLRHFLFDSLFISILFVSIDYASSFHSNGDYFGDWICENRLGFLIVFYSFLPEELDCIEMKHLNSKQVQWQISRWCLKPSLQMPCHVDSKDGSLSRVRLQSLKTISSLVSHYFC